VNRLLIFPIILLVTVLIIGIGIIVYEAPATSIDDSDFDRIISLSTEFYDATIEAEIDKILSIYSFPLEEYFGKKNASKVYVEKKGNEYFGKWKYRSGELISCTIDAVDKKDKEV